MEAMWKNLPKIKILLKTVATNSDLKSGSEDACLRSIGKSVLSAFIIWLAP